jgi:hypothetical protein
VLYNNDGVHRGTQWRPAPATHWSSSTARCLDQRYRLGAPEIAGKEAEMYALVVRVTIHNVDRTRDVLNNQVVPQVSGAPGFKAGYWTWGTGGGETNGLSMIIFDSEENARGAGDRVSAIAADAPGDVTLDGVEVREVVASA